MMQRYKAEIILFIVATIWAGTFPILKITLAEFPPFYFVALRFLIAAVVFSVVFAKQLSRPSAGEVKAALLLGLLLLLGFGSQSVGLKYTSSSNSALITGVNVLIVPFAQYIITKKRVYVENWIGVLLVTIGLYLLTQPEINGINIGDWITLICSAAWAFYIIYLDVFTNRAYNVNNMIVIQFWFVTLASFIIGVAAEDFSGLSFSSNNLLALLYTGLLATLVATTLGNRYQKFTTPIRATLVMSWETPAAVIMSLIFLKDSFKMIQLSGAVLMVLGILFSESFEYIKTAIFRQNNK